jgi:guanylate kinase
MANAISPALLVLISAPSGGGKTTLCEQLLAKRPNTIRAVTCTTRQPRPGEKDGVDYYFLDAAAFTRKVESGEFLEHATVHGNSYGTLKSEALTKLRAGADVLLNIDVQGASTICQRAEEEPELKRALVTVFLAPASMAELEARLKKRGTDTPSAMAKRLAVAREEISHWRRFQYLITSASIADDTRRMETILDAEKMRQHRVAPPSMET